MRKPLMMIHIRVPGERDMTWNIDLLGPVIKAHDISTCDSLATCNLIGLTGQRDAQKIGDVTGDARGENVVGVVASAAAGDT